MWFKRCAGTQGRQEPHAIRSAGTGLVADEVRRLTDLGARIKQDGPDLVVMADSEAGNEFCVE